MSQYNFYQQLSTNKKSITSDSQQLNPIEIKNKILEQYDLYNKLLNSDKNLQELYLQKNNLSNEILKYYGLLQKKDADWTTEDTTNLHQILNDLDNQHKNIDQQYQQYLTNQLSWLYQKFPDIYDRMVNGDTPLERTTLEHVLNAFCQSETGQIKKRDAIKSGLDYMKTRHNLPDDFFDYSKIDTLL